jgi:hypothetical protein
MNITMFYAKAEVFKVSEINKIALVCRQRQLAGTDWRSTKRLALKTVVILKNTVFGLLRRVALVRADVSKERIAFIIRVTTSNVAPSAPIPVCTANVVIASRFL